MLLKDVLHRVVIVDVGRDFGYNNVNVTRLHVLKEPLQAFAAFERFACRRAFAGI